MTKDKTRQMALFGIIMICLGVVFMRSGRLGVIFLVAGAALTIVALIKRKDDDSAK